MNTHNSNHACVGVFGATGYTGQEALRVLSRHGRIQVRIATSEGSAGQPAGIGDLDLVSGEDAPLQDIDLAFLCLPHGEAVPWAKRCRDDGVRVVDLTADHRPGSGREGGWVYGLADRAADAIRRAEAVANPGCYPTGVQLALLTLVDAGLVDASRPIVINAASGVTGAGRTPKRDLMFAEVAGDYRAYATGNGHRHLLEMRAALPGFQLLFQPHLLPVARGILETLYVPTADGADAAAFRECWRTAFADNPSVTTSEGTPTLAEVVHSDRLVLGASDNQGVQGLVTVMVSFDNLGKGAAGQAVQNMNLMLGLDPFLGLRL